MNDKEYNAMPGIRRSDLWKIRQSPLHFKYAIENREEPTDSLVFGQAAHKFTLEPGSFWEEFDCMPDVDRRTKEGKEVWGAFLLRCEGKKIIKTETFETVAAMRITLDKYPRIAAILSDKNIRTEVPFFWKDEETGELCKCKADIIAEIDGVPTIIDYKTTASCEDGAFERDARKYGYAFQAGFYSEGINKCTMESHAFMFIAQEKKPPYAARIYECDPGFVEAGRREFHRLLNMYHKCKTEDVWEGYPDSYLYEEEGL